MEGRPCSAAVRQLVQQLHHQVVRGNSWPDRLSTARTYETWRVKLGFKRTRSALCSLRDGTAQILIPPSPRCNALSSSL
uniref:Uncharacterized protein n=1 Tax=Picea glauca TaxID=3330 RepID=A0A124GNE8_PICGL|nr:hypothetical protein ABT39_MTgene4621 [Picea glauca]QHR92495.1 hypothetical protein Q903MT_gene6541 [Picea sitchensis]